MAHEHTVKAFDEDITRLRGLIAEMGGLAEVALTDALEALVRGNEDLAKSVIARDKRIDTLEAEVDKLAVRVIALRAPMADDLREVIAALKISGMLERVGDYAKNIAKRADSVTDREAFELIQHRLLESFFFLGAPLPAFGFDAVAAYAGEYRSARSRYSE